MTKPRIEPTLAEQAARFKLLADYLPAWIAIYDARTQVCQFAAWLRRASRSWEPSPP